MKNSRQIAKDITNTMLVQAYVTAKSAGMRLRVVKLDGVPRSGYNRNDDDDTLIDVEVAGGYVRKAWFVVT